MKIKLNQISIPEDRHRKVYDQKKLDKLALSMSTTGQIQPIVLDENNRLVVGGRRVRAAQLNGWVDIEYKLVKDLDELDMQIMEFEENIQREDITPAEAILAQKKLHILYEKKFGKYERQDITKGQIENQGWKQRNTAELLGITEGLLSINLKVAEAIETNPEIGKLKTREAMVRAVEQKQEEQIRKVIAAIEVGQQAADLSEGSHKYTRRVVNGSITLYEADSIVLLTTFEPESVDLVITDPLWDVEFDELILPQENTQQVVFDVMKECYRVMKPSAHGFMFYAMKNHQDYMSLLCRCGFAVHLIPLIWHKPGQGFCQDMFRDIRPDYEPCFWFFKSPQPKFLKPLNATHTHTTRGKTHQAEKPIEMLCKLIESTTVEGELVLDPFMGGGSTLEACMRLGRRGIGMDIDPKSFDMSLVRVKGGESGEKD